jgi:transcriptional regulator with XRE-family HTH domain
MEAVINQEVLRPVLGQNVKKLRESRGWTQSQMAEMLGISLQHLNRIENCKTSISDVVLFGLADLFEVPTDFLRRAS